MLKRIFVNKEKITKNIFRKHHAEQNSETGANNACLLPTTALYKFSLFVRGIFYVIQHN